MCPHVEGPCVQIFTFTKEGGTQTSMGVTPQFAEKGLLVVVSSEGGGGCQEGCQGSLHAGAYQDTGGGRQAHQFIKGYDMIKRPLDGPHT